LLALKRGFERPPSFQTFILITARNLFHGMTLGGTWDKWPAYLRRFRSITVRIAPNRATPQEFEELLGRLNHALWSLATHVMNGNGLETMKVMMESKDPNSKD
jgi:hypothetical protein